MTDQPTAALAYAREHRTAFLEALEEIVSIPSVSTDSAAGAQMRRAADWLVEKLKSLGMEKTQVMATAGHPAVYAEMLKAGPDRPTALIYGHYDVQPAEPLELWRTPPFQPAIQGDNLYGRGASDMKGQMIAVLAALEALIRSSALQVNLKFLLEGEEEIGSTNLGAFIEQHKELLACDFALNPDAGMLGPDIPTITYGLRGLAYFEVRLTGCEQDLHSGLYGGVVHNPAQVLSELIASMHDEQGRVTLPGFYDSVRPLSEKERRELSRLPNDEQYYLKATGVSQLWGEAGYSPAERVGARPTLEVNGLLSGFTGEGSKTVLPSKAMAKISMRLVPDQDPNQVRQQLKAYLDAKVPKTMQYELLMLSSGFPSITNLDIPPVQALRQALAKVWGKEPVYRREGGSISVVTDMQNILGIESVLTGFTLPDDNLHAPNEKLHLPTFYKGVDAMIWFFHLLGEQK